MLKITDRNLTASSSAFLGRLQVSVNAEPARVDQIDKAKRLFGYRHSAYKSLFEPIVQLLSDMAPPYRRCYYCEDSEHRDVEHIKPKRHYPDLCFVWINYAYACTICNGAKSDTVGIFTGTDDKVSLFTRSHPAAQALPSGPHALIDPRTEDPLDFLKLDLLTGFLVPVHNTGRDNQRARYTIDLLKLNRDAVRRNRQVMVQSYMTYLEMYEAAQPDINRANRILAEILKLPQPTVFAELKRQRNDFADVSRLIGNLPVHLQSIY